MPHRNLLLSSESILEGPQLLHPLQESKKSSTSSKKGQGGEHERTKKDSNSKYSESNEEKGHTPTQL